MKNKKVYVIATVFGLSLVIVVPMITAAQNIKNKHTSMFPMLGVLRPMIVAGAHENFSQAGKAGIGKVGKVGVGLVPVPHTRAYFGVISAINDSSFSLDVGGKNATTTYSVETTATTTIKKDGLSAAVATPSDLSVGLSGDLSIGARVVVMGTLATSTKTLTAKSVNIITHMPTWQGLEHVFKKSK